MSRYIVTRHGVKVGMARIFDKLTSRTVGQYTIRAAKVIADDLNKTQADAEPGCPECNSGVWPQRLAVGPGFKTLCSNDWHTSRPAPDAPTVKP